MNYELYNMILFKILPLEAIEQEILKGKSDIQNFPGTVGFFFSERYKQIVTSIKTLEIASEAVLYSSVEAVNENKTFGLSEYWCFAGNGQGDRWFLDQKEQAYFYDHDDEKMQPLEINFEQWLQMAFVIQQLDRYFEEFDEVPERVQQKFYDALNAIHPTLGKNYPFAV